MGTSAIIMMIVAMLVIWGGLAVAIVNLARRSPEAFTPDDAAGIHRDL